MLYRSTTCVSALLMLIPGAAIAQTAPAPAGNALGGPVIGGLCLLSTQALIANSAIGKAATARLQQLTTEAQTEIDTERTPVDADVQAYQAEVAKLTADQRRTREQSLQARLAPIQAKAQQRSREIEATRAKALQRVSTEAQPVIAQVYGAKKCGLLVDRNSVLGGNMANDLTADVVRSLDTTISTITFNRETLPAQPAIVPKRP